MAVALAGATTGFGLTLLRSFISFNKDAVNKPRKIIVLSRSPQPALEAQGVEVRPVDYNNHNQLVQSLHGVHTLLSTIGGQGLLSAQVALIAAAKEAGVQRFAPSEYAGNGYDGVDLYQPKAVVWEATKASGMEYTRFNVGLFMSVLATGTPKDRTKVGKEWGVKTGEEEALAGLRPWNYVINIRAGTADLAGDGHSKLVWTDIRDIATFVWAALDMERWPEDLGMRGDVKSFREIVEILQNVQGREFLVKETSLEDLEDEARSDASKQFYNQSRVAIARGWAMVGSELNQIFPFKPTTCEAFIEKWWSGVVLAEPAWAENKSFGADDM